MEMRATALSKFGVLDVPVKFVVPRPTYLPLGLRLKGIRLKQRYLDGPNRDVRIEQLEGL